MEIDKIYNIDCLEGMKHIPDGSIDAIICDLPYGTTQCPWDAVIPFEPMWEQYHRIAKPEAAIVLFSAEPFTSALIMSNIKEFRYDLIWSKTKCGGFLNANRQPLRQHENILVFCQTAPPYNPQGLVKGSFKNGRHANMEGKVYGDYNYNPESQYGNYPKSIIECANPSNEGHEHPTQKPVDLLRYLIRTYSNEGDTILDNCMGSGTTAVACIKEKRHFIGFELNKEYYDKACKRIDAAQRQLTLF